MFSLREAFRVHHLWLLGLAACLWRGETERRLIGEKERLRETGRRLQRFLIDPHLAKRSVAVAGFTGLGLVAVRIRLSIPERQCPTPWARRQRTAHSRLSTCAGPRA